MTGVIAWIVLSVLGVAAAAGVLAFLFNLFAGAVSPRNGWSSRSGDVGALGGILGGWGGGRGGGSGGGFGGSGGGMGGGGGASGQW